MPVQWNKVAVQPGGADTRSDPKTVPPGKMAVATNARFGVPGAVRKRQGFSKLAELALDNAGTPPFFDQALTDARALLTRGNSLWLRGADSLYSLEPNRKRWQREAQVPSAKFVYGPRFWIAGGAAIQNAERATANGVTMVAYDNIAASPTTIVAIFYDSDGTEITRTSFTGAHPRAVIVGGTICLFYINQPTADKIFMASFDTAFIRSPSALAFSVSTIASDLNTTAPTFDADIGADQQILLAYNTTTATTLKFGYVAPNGALIGAMTTISTAFTPGAVACAVEPTAGTLLVCWLQTGTTRVDGQMFDKTKASLFASVVLGTTTNVGAVEGVTCIFRSATLAEVFFDFRVSIPRQYSRVDKATVTTAGVVVQVAGWLRHATLGSKPWLIAGRVHLFTHHAGAFQNIQRTGFVVASGGLQDPCVLGAVYASECDASSVGGVLRKAFRPDVVGSAVYLTPRLVQALDPTLTTTYAGNVGVDYSQTPLFVESGGATYLTGTSVWMLDGANAVETGFNLFPEFDNSATYVSQSNGVGALIPGSYSYRLYYEWTSATGEFFQSTFAGDVVVVLSAPNNTITLKIPTLVHTLKTGVQIGIYRTLVGQGIFHRVSGMANDPTQDFVSFVDTVADVTIATAAIDYRSSSPQELDNIAPPGASVIAVGQNRVFIAGAEDPNLVLASKLQGFGVALNFNDALQIAVPPAGGAPVTALSFIGDELVIFRESAIYTVAGAGPDNVGLGGVFQQPVTISNDVGCVDAASVLRTPVGLMFKSRRGIYMLGGDGLSYVGADVERFNTEAVTSAVALPDRHEVRFTLASGRMLVFEYLERRWSDWTVGGLHSVVSKGQHVVLKDATGVALGETAGSFQDDGVSYSLIFEFGWFEIDGLQGYQRVRDMLLLGAMMGDHWLRIRAAYDFEDAFVDDVTADVAVIGAAKYGSDSVYGGSKFGGALANGLTATNVYQLRHFFWRPKCSAIKIRIEDVKRLDPTGAVDYPLLEGYRLTEILLSIGQKAGHAKPGPDRQF